MYIILLPLSELILLPYTTYAPIKHYDFLSAARFHTGFCTKSTEYWSIYVVASENLFWSSKVRKTHGEPKFCGCGFGNLDVPQMNALFASTRMYCLVDLSYLALLIDSCSFLTPILLRVLELLQSFFYIGLFGLWNLSFVFYFLILWFLSCGLQVNL